MSEAKPCAVCEGGWREYWRQLFDTKDAAVCEVHQRENAESAASPVYTRQAIDKADAWAAEIGSRIRVE